MTNLVYYQPWSLMDRWRREVDELFSGRSNASQPAVANTTAGSPSVDLQEENNRFVLRAAVPGVALKDIEVSTEDGTFTVRGHRPGRPRVSMHGYGHLERA